MTGIRFRVAAHVEATSSGASRQGRASDRRCSRRLVSLDVEASRGVRITTVYISATRTGDLLLVIWNTHKTTKYLVSPLEDDAEEEALDAAAAWFAATLVATELEDDEVGTSCATELMLETEVAAATATTVEVASAVEVVGRAKSDEEEVLEGRARTSELLWTHAAFTEATMAARARNCLGANIL